MLYLRLSGSPPFWHRRQVIMLRMIMEGKYNFSSQDWDDISEDAKDLVSFSVFYIVNFLILFLSLRLEIC